MTFPSIELESPATHNRTKVSTNPAKKTYSELTPCACCAFTAVIVPRVASVKSINQIIVLTSCKIRYVKGWSLVAAKSMISMTETMVQTALMMRTMKLVLFAQYREQA